LKRDSRALGKLNMPDASSPSRDTETQRLIDELFHDGQLARAEAREFEEASKAKDRFVAMLSHELRTPLQPVLAIASMLLRDSRLPSDLVEEVRTIQRNVQLEARLIDDLLDLTRIRTGKLKLDKIHVNMHSVIARAVDICEHEAIAKHLTFSVALSATRTWVHADPGRLHQVMWNLIKNAVKFTATGGQVTVQTSDTADGRIRVQVVDTGIGIDAETLPRIFDAFEQGDTEITRKYGGLGLGLSISKALAQAHDGEIFATSEGRDRGATFSLSLPTVEGPKSSPARAPAAVPIPPRILRILLVEDDRDTSRVLARLLRSLKHEVTVAEDCATAINRGVSGAFDLIICDLGLPDGSGLDLFVRLKHAAPVKGIALTGFGAEEDIRRTIEAGFACHLTKPITLDQLVQSMLKLFP
jgi:signal transduction histidine kinase